VKKGVLWRLFEREKAREEGFLGRKARQIGRQQAEGSETSKFPPALAGNTQPGAQAGI